MKFKQQLTRLKQSKEFKDWKKQNPDIYLVHGFLMIKDDTQTSWQIGFYDKKSDKVTSFFMETPIKISPPAEIFKKQGIVKELNPEEIRLDLKQALKIAEKEKEKYKESTLQTVAIVQNIDIGTIWNITYLTQSSNALNFKISVTDGKILDQLKTSFIQHQAS